MRSLDECKAEIFRRSEKRIQRRRAIVGSSLTLGLVLCVCVAFAVLKAPANSPVPQLREPVTEGTQLAAPVTDSIRLTVNGREVSQNPLADQVSPEIPLNWLKELYTAPEDDSASIPDSSDLSNSSVDWKDETVNRIYTEIVFTMPDGSREVFTLSGNILTWETTGQAIKLTADRQAELNDLLGYDGKE